MFQMNAAVGLSSPRSARHSVERFEPTLELQKLLRSITRNPRLRAMGCLTCRWVKKRRLEAMSREVPGDATPGAFMTNLRTQVAFERSCSFGYNERYC